PTPAPTAEPEQNDDDSDFGTGVLALVNSYRSSVGLSSFKYSSAMQKAADTRAKECASSFSHTRPDGSKAYTALTERGISFTAFGENIFAASGMSSVSAEYVVEQWMASQGHRENILRDGFTHMCIGVASQGEEIYVVQLFGAGIS
ncbi:MAG: CAP domain-containing protein, partial [Clostridia bacterium]|nr:CAP domain-containing protein [Clostridia bacterium]